MLFLFYDVSKPLIFIFGLFLVITCSDSNNITSNIKEVKDENYYKRLLKNDTLNAHLWNELGKFYLVNNDKIKGAICLEKSLMIDSSNFDVSFKLSEIYLKKGSLNKANLCLNNCIKLDALQTQPYLNIAQLFIFKSDYKSAFKYINSSLRINNYIPQAYFMKGVCYKHIKDTVKSLSSFKTAIEIDPNYLPSYNEIGLILTTQNDSNGIYYYKNSLNISSKNPEALFGLAWSYQTFGKKELAIDKYEELLEVYPNYIDAKFNLGLLYLDLGNTLLSKKYFQEVILAQPKNIEAFYNLYKCSTIEGDYRKANEFKLLVLDLDSSFFKNIYK